MAIDFGWLAILQHSILLEIAVKTTSSPTVGLTHFAEDFLQTFALFLKIILELIAILIIAVSLMITLRKLLLWQQLRMRLLRGFGRITSIWQR